MAGSSPSTVALSSIMGSPTLSTAAATAPIGEGSPTVLMGVATMRYAVMRPLGLVGMSHVTLMVECVRVRACTVPMPEGTVGEYSVVHMN